MSHLNISLSSFGNSRVRVRHGISLRKLNFELRVLARAVLSSLHSNGSDLADEQIGRFAADTRNTCVQESTQGCRAHVSDAEYQHLVDLGHWHHRRQRRRNRFR